MIKKYGKFVDMCKIDRDLLGIKKLNKECEESALKYDLSKRPHRKKCIVCKSEERVLFLSVYGRYNYYECKKCNMLTCDSFPNVEEMYTSDNTENLGLYTDDKLFLNRMNMIAKPKADFCMDVINNNVNSWIDIGCGGGELLYYLMNEYNIKVMGLESDELECSFLKSKSIPFYKAFINTNKIDDKITSLINGCEVVSCINVLEHIEEPTDYVNYLSNAMRTGTYLILEVPKHPSLASFANLTSKGNIYRHITPPVHLQVFSTESLNILLQRDFNIIGSWEFGQGFMDVINNAMILSDIENNEIYRRISKAQNEVQKAIDEAGLADQILIVAKRK